MKTHGKCHCGEPIVEATYKLKTGVHNFRRVFRCKKTISHTHSEEDLSVFDTAWHKKRTELMVC